MCPETRSNLGEDELNDDELKIALEHDTARQSAESLHPAHGKSPEHCSWKGSEAPPPPTPEGEVPYSMKLPEGVTQAVWIPLKMGEEFFYECKVEGFGHLAKGVSRDKRRALAYALEALSTLVLQKKETVDAAGAGNS